MSQDLYMQFHLNPTGATIMHVGLKHSGNYAL